MARSATTSKPARRSAGRQPTPSGPSPVQASPVPANPTPADRLPAAGEERCTCGDPVVRIDLLIDGDEITMVSCSNCDRRSWHRGGQEVELDGVLADLSSVPTRYRRDLASR